MFILVEVINILSIFQIVNFQFFKLSYLRDFKTKRLFLTVFFCLL